MIIYFIGFVLNTNETNYIIEYLKNKQINYEFVIDTNINYDYLNKCDYIICGTNISPNNIFIINLLIDKVILYLNKPKDLLNPYISKMYHKNLFNLTIGCISNGLKQIKYPSYLNSLDSETKINNTNDYVKNINLDLLLIKNICCLNDNEDLANIKNVLYNILCNHFPILCPGKLFNNFDINNFNPCNFIFNICTETYYLNINGCISDNLVNSCLNGNIPIYCGNLDDIDKSIFNMNRIIHIDPLKQESILSGCNLVLKLFTNHDELLKFYNQPVFCEGAYQQILKIKDNLKNKLNEFIYNKDIVKYNFDHVNKINGIDHIVWINLDRSQKRREHMEKILCQINIPNIRISAVDGKTEDFSYITKNNCKTNYETACTLSHIKAYSYLKNITGNHFLVLEDDISLSNLKYFNTDLESIIKNSPDFDVLQIHKISIVNRNKINQLYNKKILETWSTAAYVISKSGLNKLLKMSEYKNNNFTFNHPLSVADDFVYNYLNTIVYKYSFITTLNEDSDIHQDHIPSHIHSYKLELQSILTDILFK
jgi:GR25 family glycosyltransferase involved in LPS biosynthesis